MKKTSKALALTIACLMVIMTALVCAPVYAASQTSYSLPGYLTFMAGQTNKGRESVAVDNFKTFFLVHNSSDAAAVGKINTFYTTVESSPAYKSMIYYPVDSTLSDTTKGTDSLAAAASLANASRTAAVLAAVPSEYINNTDDTLNNEDVNGNVWFVRPTARSYASENGLYTVVIAFVAPSSGTYSYKAVLDKLIPSATYTEKYEVYKVAGGSKAGDAFANILTDSNKLASVTTGTGTDDYTLSGDSVSLSKDDEIWFTFQATGEVGTDYSLRWYNMAGDYGTLIDELSVTLTATAATPDTADAGISIAAMAVVAAATGIVIVSKKRRNK